MKRILCISFLLVVAHTNLFAQWLQTAGPSGGGVSDFAYTDNNVILAASFEMGNGVYASTDNGASWHASGLQGIRLSHISAKGQTVIASSTQNAYNETDTIYRSSDAGATWQIVKFNTDTGIAIGILPNISNVCSICFHNTEWFISAQGEQGRILSSSDDGKTWSILHPDFSYAYPVILLSADVFLVAGYNVGGIIKIRRSNDNGISWTDASNGIDQTVASEIYCGTVSGNAIWFGTSSGIISSTNEGVEWHVSLKLPDPAEYVRCIDGKEDRIVAITSFDSIVRTESGGNGWETLIGNGLQVNGSFFSASFSKYDSTLFLGSSAGIISSRTFAYHWQYSTTGLLAAQVIDLAVSNGKIFAATERGVSYSPDQGSSWHDPQNLGELQDVAISGFVNGASSFYAFGAGLYSWSGSSWSALDTSHIDALAEGSSGRIFAARQIGNSIIGTGEIDYSDNQGGAWTRAITDTNSFDSGYYFMPRCLASDGNGTIVAIERGISFQSFTSIYRVFRSLDNGMSWEFKGNVNSPVLLYYANNAYYMGTRGNGLYKSNDNGASWVKYSSLASGIDVTSIFKIGGLMVISVTGNGNAFDGLYSSTDDGASWKYSNYGNPNISGNLKADATYLYGGGPSVWKRKLNELGVHDGNTAQAGMPLEVYPNPAADMIHIHFDSPKPLQAVLNIYDEKGMAVYKQRVQFEGSTNDLPISLNGISDGAYYARLTDGSNNILSSSKFVVKRR